MPTKAQLAQAATVVTPEDLTDLQALEEEFEQRIEKAYSDGRTYMMSQYVKMLASVKSEAKRISARFDRDIMAAHRKAAADLKKERKNAESST